MFRFFWKPLENRRGEASTKVMCINLRLFIFSPLRMMIYLPSLLFILISPSSKASAGELSCWVGAPSQLLSGFRARDIIITADGISRIYSKLCSSARGSRSHSKLLRHGRHGSDFARAEPRNRLSLHLSVSSPSS